MRSGAASANPNRRGTAIAYGALTAGAILANAIPGGGKAGTLAEETGSKVITKLLDEGASDTLAHCGSRRCAYTVYVMNLLSLAAHQLRRAADIVDKIEALQTELSATLGSSEVASDARKIKRKMSDAGRLAIAAAQKIRWSKIKAKSFAKPAKAKRKISVAAKAKMAAAAKARWAKAKAAGKNAL